MPQKFVDNKGQQWVLHLTLGRAREIAGVLAIDVLNPNDYQELMASLGARLAYVWYLVEEQAADNGVNVADFELRLLGKGFANNASDALLLELIDFFQRYDQTALVVPTQTSLETMQAARKRAESPQYATALKKNADRMSTAMDAALAPEANSAPPEGST